MDGRKSVASNFLNIRCIFLVHYTRGVMCVLVAEHKKIDVEKCYTSAISLSYYMHRHISRYFYFGSQFGRKLSGSVRITYTSETKSCFAHVWALIVLRAMRSKGYLRHTIAQLDGGFYRTEVSQSKCRAIRMSEVFAKAAPKKAHFFHCHVMTHINSENILRCTLQTCSQYTPHPTHIAACVRPPLSLHCIDCASECIQISCNA